MSFPWEGRALHIEPREDREEFRHFYLDGSALSKIFSPEVGSETMDRILERPANLLHVSAVSVFEAKALIARRLTRGRIRPDRYNDILSRMDRFLGQWEESGKMLRADLDPLWEREVSILIEQAARWNIPLEAMEAVHAVLATKVGEAQGVTLVSTSASLLEVGARLGLGGIQLEGSF